MKQTWKHETWSIWNMAWNMKHGYKHEAWKRKQQSIRWQMADDRWQMTDSEWQDNRMTDDRWQMTDDWNNWMTMTMTDDAWNKQVIQQYLELKSWGALAAAVWLVLAWRNGPSRVLVAFPGDFGRCSVVSICTHGRALLTLAATLVWAWGHLWRLVCTVAVIFSRPSKVSKMSLVFRVVEERGWQFVLLPLFLWSLAACLVLALDRKCRQRQGRQMDAPKIF
jgi:hypothetical protein